MEVAGLEGVSSFKPFYLEMKETQISTFLKKLEKWDETQVGAELRNSDSGGKWIEATTHTSDFCGRQSQAPGGIWGNWKRDMLLTGMWNGTATLESTFFSFL